MSEQDYSYQHPPGCRGCPLDKTGRGFALGCGDPAKAKYAIILEALGKDEISFELKPNPNRAFLQTKEECDKEFAIRRRDYPDLDDRWLRLGVPVVGQTGLALQFWIWPKVGIRREEAYIDNTIRCLPPKKGNGQYPTGVDRKAAEKHCRQYDRIDRFCPDTIVFSLHPAALLREITPLPLVVKDFEKIRDFTVAGRRVLTLLGGKSTGAFARYGSNVTKWRGHFAKLASDWSETYKQLFEFTTKRRKKVNASDEFFGVPETTVARGRAKTEKPEELLPGRCKSWKRHKHNHPPKCGHTDCWAVYEERKQNEIHRLTSG